MEEQTSLGVLDEVWLCDKVEARRKADPEFEQFIAESVLRFDSADFGDESADFLRWNQNILQAGARLHLLGTYIHKDGSVIWIERRLIYNWDVSGNHIIMVTMIGFPIEMPRPNAND